MATETSRQISVRRITAPGDDSTYVDLKVIDKIMFIDPRQQYQEWELTFANNLNAGRKTRVVEVGEDKLKVERIDALSSVHTHGGRYQAWETTYENGDNPPVHYQTHKRKIYHLNKDGTKDENVWIEVQRIDKIWFKDPKENYQERVWELVWPDNENPEWDYQDLPKPTKDWDKTSINPPWRLDPFQTIVGCSFGGYMLVLYGTNKIAYVPMTSIASPAGKVKKKTLVQSNWSPPPWYINAVGFWGWDTFDSRAWHIQTFQAKLSAEWHVLCANMRISSDGIITVPEKSDQTPCFNTKDTLLKSADSTSPYSDAIPVLPQYVRGPLATVQMNGSGRTMYNDRQDKFSWSPQSGVQRVSVYSDNLDYYTFDQVPVVVRYPKESGVSVVLQDGGRYSDFIFQGYSYKYMGAGTEITRPQLSTVEALLGETGTYENSVYYYGPGNSDVTATINYVPGYTFNGTLSTKSHIAVYEPKTVNQQKLDEIRAGVSNVSISVSTTYPELTYSVSISGYFGHSNSYTHMQEGGETFVLRFPPALGTSSDDVYLIKIDPDSGGGSGGYFQTPYGSKPLPSPALEKTWTLPWLHVSNGQHLMQGFQWNNGLELWLDRVNYGPTLASAIGCDLKDIRTVLFDIKKSDIDKLK
jgi:hypothetical protein